MTPTPDLEARLRALYVWPQSVADHHADVLTPRQIKELYAVGLSACEAADELARRAERIAALLPYIQHKGGCRMRAAMSQPCVCGLVELLSVHTTPGETS